MSAAHPLEPDEDRRSRHLFVLKSLTDRSYTLALKAADKAEAQLDTPDPAPDEAPPAPQPNHHRTFKGYVTLVRLLVALEHRIANNSVRPARLYRASGDSAKRYGAAADPRRAPLQQFIHQATRNSPDRAGLRREAVAALDDALDRDPARTLPAAVILHDVCEEFGLPFDLAHLPDEFLEPPTPIASPTTGPPIRPG